MEKKQNLQLGLISKIVLILYFETYQKQQGWKQKCLLWSSGFGWKKKVSSRISSKCLRSKAEDTRARWLGFEGQGGEESRIASDFEVLFRGLRQKNISREGPCRINKKGHALSFNKRPGQKPPDQASFMINLHNYCLTRAVLFSPADEGFASAVVDTTPMN